MNELLKRLSSRTLWIAVGTVIMLIANEKYTEASSVAIAYILGEKALDATGSLKGTTIVNPYVNKLNVDSTASDEVDRSDIVTGAHRIRTFDEKTDE